MTLELCGFKRKVDMFEINDETKRLKSSLLCIFEKESNEKSSLLFIFQVVLLD